MAQVSKGAIEQLSRHCTMMQGRALDEIYFNYDEVTNEVYFDAVLCPPDEDFAFLMADHRAVAKIQMASRHADARLVISDPT